MTPDRLAFVASFTSAALILGGPAIVLVLLYSGLLTAHETAAAITAVAWAVGGALLRTPARRSLAGFLAGAVPGVILLAAVVLGAGAIVWAVIHGQAGSAIVASFTGLAAVLWSAGFAVGWFNLARKSA